MEGSVLGTTPPRGVRAMLAVGYAIVAIAAPAFFFAPRAFWTVLMPLVPIGFTLIGFHAWRRICPLAAIGSLGAMHTRTRRRVPRWLARWPMTTSLALLFVALWARFMATNGDGLALGTMLVGLAVSAALFNFFFSGKSWCNYVCPVGVVERIYTDAAPLRETPNARCEPCTGCVRACPDIDQDKSYRSSLTSTDRRLATYAFPGLVLGFYTYFRLREGEWAAFFDGRWTERAADLDAMRGAGFVFAPNVPAALAAALTLASFAATSGLAFFVLERALTRATSDRELLRHRMLTVAAFVAFNVFYIFAGAPSLALVPGARLVTALVVPIVSTIVLVRRWSRVRSHADAKRRLTVLTTR